LAEAIVEQTPLGDHTSFDAFEAMYPCNSVYATYVYVYNFSGKGREVAVYEKWCKQEGEGPPIMMGDE
jgi:hypothetical protein